MRRHLGRVLPANHPGDQLEVLLRVEAGMRADQPLLSSLLAAGYSNPPTLYQNWHTPGADASHQRWSDPRALANRSTPPSPAVPVPLNHRKPTASHDSIGLGATPAGLVASDGHDPLGDGGG
ncbi:hypothetical protein [Kitasatospora sp. NPDC059803]|uniref:hypothetical protein n=1 Tax=Kitasatospora sp. NPDC059803 TaxID=3346953 RepID=UPI0036644CBD